VEDMALGYEGGKVLEGVLIPRVCVERLEKVRERIGLIVSRYGSLSTYGKPPYEDPMDVACVVYLNEKLNVSLEKLSQYLGFSDKTAIYKMVKRVKEESKFTIWRDGRFETVRATVDELINMVEGELKARAREFIEDAFQSSIVKSFMEKPILKRHITAGKQAYLTNKDKMETLRYIIRIMEYFKKLGKPTNPDFWSEVEVEKAIHEIWKDGRDIYAVKVALRRIAEWRMWFEGRIGAIMKYARPVDRAIFYEHYLKIKQLWKEGKIPNEDFLTLWLHLTLGCREGSMKDGAKITAWDQRPAGLLGLRWEDLSIDYDGIPILKVYESKTEKLWESRLDIIDPDPIPTLMKYKEEKGYILRSIYNGKTPIQIYEHYIRFLARLSNTLNLPFTLKPHDIRRSHVSILLEFGVDLLPICRGEFGLGVGWEDLKTAEFYYARFQKTFKEKIFRQIALMRAQLQKELLSKAS
jgi:integrase